MADTSNQEGGGKGENPDPATTHRIAYYLWRFPILSETFIQAEIAALQAQNVDCTVFAQAPQDIEFLDDKARSLMGQTVYLQPLSFIRRLSAWSLFIREQPQATFQLLKKILRLDYAYDTNVLSDLRLFGEVLVLAQFLRKHRIDHVHSPWANYSASTASFAADLLKIPFTMQARAYELHRTKAVWALEEKFAAAKKVITNSHFNIAHLQQILRVELHGKLCLIYDGIDLDRFEPRHQRSDGPFRILCVGRLVEQKGVEYLLKACSILKRQGTEFECVVVGAAVPEIRADYHTMLERLRLELDLVHEIRFTGAMSSSDVIEEYRQADVFVLPCVVASDGARDITPNTLLEAMAMELPVISTTISAIPELIENGVNGILIAPNDEQQLAARLSELTGDPDKRRRLGEAARLHVRSNFDINKSASKFIEVFGAVCDQPGDAPDAGEV